MSAYSDWKCGSLSDDEYKDQCNWEGRQDKFLEDKSFNEAFCNNVPEDNL